MKRAVIIQCRLSSSRLPGKALLDLNGAPVLEWTLHAMKKVKADKYFVATDEASYDELLPVCKKEGFECFKGPLENVLERYCLLIKKIKADTVIRATADNPFLFYEAAQESADEFDKRRGTNRECDYLTWTGLPHGSGVEIFDGKALLKAAEYTDDPYDTEHVGPALYNHKDNFRCVFEEAPLKYRAPHLRTTIDTYNDYIRAVAISNLASGASHVIESNTSRVIAGGASHVIASGAWQSSPPFSAKEIIKACESISVKSPLVFLPSVKAGCGTGHLVRCLKLARETNAFIYIPDNAELKNTNEIVQKEIFAGLNPNLVINEIPDESFSPVFVCDLMSVPKNLAEKLSKYGTLISIDDGSDNDEYFDCVVDIIPSLKERKFVNLKNINFIDFPKNKRTLPKIKVAEEINSILIAFGGEDPAEMTEKVLEKCRNIFGKVKITFVTKKAIKPHENETRYESIPNLKEELAKYDLVLTHYGLTALEAVHAGAGVILFPTTSLHEKLSEKYCFANCAVEDFTKDGLSEFIESGKIYPNLFSENSFKSEHEKENESVQISLSDYVKHISLGKKYNCPVCQKSQKRKNDLVVERNMFRTYRRCSECGLVYISWSAESERKYEKEYFFESYKKQYGKTYKEDFNFIKASCMNRVSVIKQLLSTDVMNSKKKNPTVLDIGCAYGPFLQAAGEYGFQPYGTDICEDAVKSVQDELHFPACTSAFPEIDTVKEFGMKYFDAVTMWYVIEHFKNLDAVLLKARKLLKTGGVFAFSTPSGEGVSAKSDRHNFYNISPTDHFSVWEPSRASKILKKYGFKVVKIISTGHHPERFPSIKKSGAEKGSLQWTLVDKYSRLQKLGDTVEIYCVKTERDQE